MKIYRLAWYLPGQTARSDVKYTDVMAATLQDAKDQFVHSGEPTALFLDDLCRDLTA